MAVDLSRAVVERRAPDQVAGDDAQKALWRALDFFPTPPWAARAGAELVLEVDPNAEAVWEPACGEGHIAEPLRKYFPHVFASDIFDYGYGGLQDFLLGDRQEQTPGRRGCTPGGIVVDWIITNPPFKLAAQFVERGLELATVGVAVLVRLAWLESVDRFHMFYRAAHPLTVLAPFAERVPMQLGAWDPELSSATAYAWFIFRKTSIAPKPTIRPIGPGARARLSKPEDVRRFCKAAPSPLFEVAS